jgi:hypothetical protein
MVASVELNRELLGLSDTAERDEQGQSRIPRALDLKYVRQPARIEVKDTVYALKSSNHRLPVSSSGSGWQRCPAGLRCAGYEFSPPDDALLAPAFRRATYGDWLSPTRTRRT